MARVTIGTRDFVIAMRSGMPCKADIAAVTFETRAVLNADFGCRIRAEPDHRWPLLAAPNSSRVRATGAMTGLALQLTVPERTSRIGRHRMLAAE